MDKGSIWEKYLRIASQIAYYFKGKRIQRICKTKCELFAAAGGDDHKISIFSNSLEHMGSLCGHKFPIKCLTSLPNSSLLASGSSDGTTKLWNLKTNSLICTLELSTLVLESLELELSEEQQLFLVGTNSLCALCYVTPEVLVTGSENRSLLVWEHDICKIYIYIYI